MAAKVQYELTPKFIEELKKELVYLKDVKRNENLVALKEAREQGDLSENADYDAAKNEQAQIEARIAEIEVILKNVVKIKASDDAVANIFKVVKLKFLSTDKVSEFHLVGSLEANPKIGKISIESPLGKSLKGHEKGEIVTVKSETGSSFNVEILEISNDNS